MVEIWRWPKASLSASLTACMEMPSRLAVSRSTLTIARRPPSWASETTSRSTGALRSFSASLVDQVATSLASLPTSVYWYWARLVRVLIWMSCTGWKYRVTPGMPATLACRRSTTWLTVARRASRGFRMIFRCPAFGVGLIELTPITVTTPSTSLSVRRALATVACSRCISAKETSGPASMTALTSPVSCGGRKPLGTMR